jgi:hypothetical protein
LVTASRGGCNPGLLGVTAIPFQITHYYYYYYYFIDVENSHRGSLRIVIRVGLGDYGIGFRFPLEVKILLLATASRPGAFFLGIKRP